MTPTSHPDALARALDEAITGAVPSDAHAPFSPTTALAAGHAAHRRRTRVRGALAALALVAVAGVGMAVMQPGGSPSGSGELVPADVRPDDGDLTAPDVSWNNGFTFGPGVELVTDVGDFLPEQRARHDLAIVAWQGRQWYVHGSGLTNGDQIQLSSAPLMGDESLDSIARDLATMDELRPAGTELGRLGGMQDGDAPFVDGVEVVETEAIQTGEESESYTSWVLRHDGHEYWAWLPHASDALPWIERADVAPFTDRKDWAAALTDRVNDRAPEPLLSAAERGGVSGGRAGEDSARNTGFATLDDSTEILDHEIVGDGTEGDVADLLDGSYVQVGREGMQWFVVVSPEYYGQWQAAKVGADADVASFRSWLAENSDAVHLTPAGAL